MSIRSFQKFSEKKLIGTISKSTGRNNRGIITSGQKGGGHKQKYRFIDFRRAHLALNGFAPRDLAAAGGDQTLSNDVGSTVSRLDYAETSSFDFNDQTSKSRLSGLGYAGQYNIMEGTVQKIDYDPYRNARIALIHYSNGKKSYILHPVGLNIGNKIFANPDASSTIGNSVPLQNLPLGVQVHAIELHPGKGAQIARAAGAVAQIVAKEGKYVSLRLPSGQVRLIPGLCWATVGQVGNIEFNQKEIGKAGRNRWLGRRPHVRGAAKNPVDHPHGGGEGRNGVGHKHPKNPWGDCALGKKTRKKKKYSDSFITR
jgi:large subunit ribosomal protein L2